MEVKAVGLCGPSGSGKSSLAKMLLDDYDAVIISLDDYFFPDPPHKKYREREKNWELPENVDWPAVRAVVATLKDGKEARGRKMQWETNSYITEVVRPRTLLIVEGFLLLHDADLRAQLDLAVYIDIPDEVGIRRRIERAQSVESESWYREVTFPEYAPRRSLFAQSADIVLNGELPLAQNLSILEARLNAIMGAQNATPVDMSARDC